MGVVEPGVNYLPMRVSHRGRTLDNFKESIVQDNSCLPVDIEIVHGSAPLPGVGICINMDNNLSMGDNVRYIQNIN